ncbi:sensor domain-containing phosphodiesterase [Cronobacter malonaticus]|uniref:sensor domain-containing phosphodiesterase n=1 Tax=Cronobacter malonaticus TaxID=413503 RepID=UPI000519CDC5|nr:sensor domain-containing phosphodiesterase [Cronobacter malonaticus]KIU65910.1 biofilm formation regulator HmsP [Cronobacter malonaticus ENBT0334]MDI6467864.1 sensor domain-containing phosphodiesterase [Cronobacter malonaticus]MDI7689601.1 sensor domain-containing phosphodiesterase [Cronobacter malonaticus]MDI9329028.1 sensor domain-containing phosphodiesterase [Cronobacter malonaticus]MDI9361009.1 sensor domain-containing phosphodiesterase [Cronobacter malonaticus]
MRVSRSLTIKQMAMVSAVSVFFLFIFSVVLLFHFVQSHRYHTAMQMESIARSVRQPLSAAILKANIPEAEAILRQIKPAGVISRADVVLPNQFQALRMRFTPERPIPVTLARVFELPVQISLPLYSLERPANPQPLAYLVLQADSWRMYRFIINAISTLLTTFLLLALILSVAITWCINRLILHPLRDITRTLNALDAHELAHHQLAIPRLHKDDEIGMLVRTYNRNQQALAQQLDEARTSGTRFPLTGLPNQALLVALLEQAVAGGGATALLYVACEPLREVDESQREALLLARVDKLRSVLTPRMVLAQISQDDFAIIAHGVKTPEHAVTLTQQLLAALNEPPESDSGAPACAASIGVAMFDGRQSASTLYQSAISAALDARRSGVNQVAFFGESPVSAQESAMQNALARRQYAVWLQPQVDMRNGNIVGAEALLRERQPDGEWSLPVGLIDNIESSGLIVTVGDWVLEEACQILARWQAHGIMLPLSVNVSSLQLLKRDLVQTMLQRLERYAIKPGTLILEMTESQRIDDTEAAIAILRPLREAGVRIALDDFGMGYSSLSQLQKMKALPVDSLKIDKSFIDSLPDDDSVVSAIISMAKKLNLELVAEGIQNEAQRDWLLNAGVTVGQGYLFGKAATPAAFEDGWLAKP